ncbi:MAG: nucleoside hydrolase, partial [Chloroflexota bacterium]|nr:nucleoside hydrolase [Chloroflexota bacterium]
IKAISLMGGAIGLGNTTPAAEFNIYCDPEAAAIVFACGRPITVSPLEVTHQALANEEVLARLRAIKRPVATFAADLMSFFGETYRNIYGFPAPPLHDPCAVAAVVDPTILHAHSMHVEIETRGEWTAGRMVCDVYGRLGKEANARVGYGLEVERFWDLVIETLATY